MVGFTQNTLFEKNSNFPFFHPYSRRFHLMLLLMTGYFCTIYMRTNLGMTMTCMVNSSAVLELENSLIEDFSELSPNLNRSRIVPSRCGRPKQAIENSSDFNGEALLNDYGGELVWSLNVQDMLFSATFFGALITTLPAGYIAQRTSPKAILLITALNYIILTAIFPLVVKNATHHLVFAVRFLMGIGEGLIQPTIDTLISRWIPISEKGLAASMYTTGAQLAGAFGIPFSTILCVSEWQWPAVYYITALFSLIWPCVFFATVTNKPSQTKIMTKSERTYLHENLPQGDQNVRPPIPWKGMLTSIPFFSCLLCAFTYSMVLALTQTYQPTFFKEVLYLPLADNGFYGATTQAVIVVVKLSWGVTMNKIKQNRFSNTTGCKISQTFGSIVIAVFLVLLGFFSDCANPLIALFLYCGISAGLGSITNGYYASMLSLAPDYTGLLSSIVAMFGIFGMLATTRVVSFFRYTGVLEEWRIIYCIMAGMMILSGIIFLFFGKGESQEWGTYKAKIGDLESARQSKRIKIASICDTTPIPYKRAII